MNPTRIVSIVIGVIALVGVLVIALAGPVAEPLADSAVSVPVSAEAAEPAPPPVVEIVEPDVASADPGFDSWVESAPAESQDSVFEGGGEDPGPSGEDGQPSEDSPAPDGE